jgi:dTDP-glucose 4,6-dehydratase
MLKIPLSLEAEMKLMITGAAGFIGSAFVRRLEGEASRVVVADALTYAGDRARLDDREGKIDFRLIDIADCAALSALFSEVCPDAIVHFAAETHVDRSILYPERFITSNVVGTTNLLSLARAHGVQRFVHISTDEVYGDLRAGESARFTEASPVLPNSPYSASKASADMFVRSYQKTYGLPVVTVRPSNNYGPWQYPEKLIPLTVAKIMLGEKIPVYGRGENIRTWLYVEDCADAILAVLKKGQVGEIYNIGSDEEAKNIDVVRRILSLMGAGEELIEYVADRPGHDFRYAVDSSKLRAEVGWRPSVDFETGMERTVLWYKEHREWLLDKKSRVDDFVKDLRREFERRQAGTPHCEKSS